MRVAMEHERAQGRQVYDVHEKNLGYDIISLDLNSGELRLIEVKGIGGVEGNVMLTPNEYRVAQDRPDCYWLYVVTNCDNDPTLFPPIENPAILPWGEVVKVQHYAVSLRDLRGATPEVIRKHYEKMDQQGIARRAGERLLAVVGFEQSPQTLRAAHALAENKAVDNGQDPPQTVVA